MLDPKRLGIAAGILGGLAMFVFTLIAKQTGYATQWLSMLVDIYPGYHISFVGSFVGMVYGFIDGFVSLFLLAWIYNKLEGTL